ncbi:NAD(P)/FAD-dependent oxidoreductase [Streptomyces sp. RTd22]|uniref:NAD(P)/FAD-dependent oxidoreductase n=1 Tax=Streptomyces sp. RTd22 TaxID=1841249 RepID=UPI0007C54E76|nr:FAD/NAD(P)-binding oxidoreductase [Streptomyces sp. RTd22]
MHIVVVGASLAGVRTVQLLRRRGSEARITLVGAEPTVACDRPPLSKSYLADPGAEAPPLLSAAELATLGVEPLLGTTATGLDPSGRTVALRGAPPLPYDALVIATGSAPRTLPGLRPCPGVHMLRTAEDAAAIRAGCRAGARLAVVGGGFIGAEVASTARSLGCAVTIVEPQPALMVRGLGPVLGTALTGRHVRRGIAVRLGATVAGIEDDGRGGLRGVRLGDGGLVPADLVVLGVGSRPATRWLEGSGLVLRDGVVCDQHLGALGAADVYAAGDIARWHHPRYGTDLRVEHWTNAADQASVVAANLTGTPLVCDAVPYVWSDQLGGRLRIHGRVGAEDEVRTVAGDPDEGDFTAIAGSGGTLRAVVGFGGARELAPYQKLLRTGGGWHQALALAEERRAAPAGG